MKLAIDFAKLLRKKAITPDEFERFMEVSEKEIPNYDSDILKGAGWVVVNYGFMALYIDSSIPPSVMLFEGMINIALGFFLVKSQSDRLLFTTICFLLGTILTISSVSEWVSIQWQA